MTQAVENILSRIDAGNLPVLPRVLVDLMEATQRNDVSFDELAKIIGQDAGLSSKVLAAANSSFYRQWGEITDLNRVIIVLGLANVKTIAITRAVQQFFSKLSHGQHKILEIIWYRSLTCAYLARHLAKLTAYDFPDQAYLTGLIHRLGQLILLECFPKEYSELLLEQVDGQQIAEERKRFGAAHNEVGAFLIESWNIQAFVSDAVQYQYQSAESIADSAKLVKIINLASQLSCMDARKKLNLFIQADTLFGLNSSFIETMLAEIKPLIDQSAGSFGISIVQAENEAIKNLTTVEQRDGTQKMLGERIKDFAMEAAVREQMATPGEINTLVAMIQRDISALFGFQVAAVFLYRKGSHKLEGVTGEQVPDALWSTISISLESDRSLLARALVKNQILHSFNSDKLDAEAIVDRQICRLLGTEGMLLIPLYAEGQALGVIAAGLKKSEVSRLKANAGFMVLFARQAAQALLAIQQPGEQAHKAVDELRSSYHLHARKLVHEVNNPLSIINNYLYLLGLKLGEENSDEVRIIQEEIDRVSKIIIRLPELPDAAVQEEQGEVDVNVLLLDLITLFKAGIFKTQGINVSLKLDDGLPRLASSKSKLNQVLSNLIKNAAEAMPAGGNLALCTRDRVFLGKSCYVEIQVSDNGPGLTEAVMSHLFTPVSSTKGKQHSGLGLTIAKSLIDELGGTISCSSTAGKGTTFQIFLPRSTLPN